MCAEFFRASRAVSSVASEKCAASRTANNFLARKPIVRRMCAAFRMGGRVVECARLESVLGLTVYEGSNPSPSALCRKRLTSRGCVGVGFARKFAEMPDADLNQ